jgi:ribosomal protein S12 methylthiotransferase accessory factor
MRQPSRDGLRLRDVPASTAMETIRKARPLLSPRSGILRRIGGAAFFAGDPVCFSLGNLASDPSRFLAQKRHADRSGGAGFSLPDALAAAIGEGVERYCMRFCAAGELAFGSHRRLSRTVPMVPAERWRMHSAVQVERVRRRNGGRGAVAEVLTKDAELGWAWGYSLTEESWKLVPAFMVYLPYAPLAGEARCGWNTSTGLACGNTLEEAVLAGLCELMERDAFALCWLHQVLPRRVRLDSPELAGFVASRFHADHPAVDLEVWDLTLDLEVPVVAVRLRRSLESGPGVFLGAAARLDPEAALRKALAEVAQCVPCCRYTLRQSRDWQPQDDFSDVVNFERHSIFYLKRPDLIPKVCALREQDRDGIGLSAMPRRGTGSVLGDLRRCVEALARRGFEPLVVDLTTPDIGELGLRVVRVLAPGLMNLHGNHNWPWLGCDRLWQAPRDLGWDGAGEAEDGLNPFPHPFP